jgi:hypothetical protein
MQIFTHLTANDVQLTSFPFKRELSMEAYLIENEGVLGLDSDTFSNVKIIDDELTLKQGGVNQIKDGRLDILATYSQEYIAIVELKLGELNEIHLNQLEHYLLQKEQVLTNPKYSGILPDFPKWIGVLVGSSINPSLAAKIIGGYQSTDGLPIAALTLQRFRSKDGNIFIATDTYFRDRSRSKDRTQYNFNGKVLNKRNLALNIIKHYIELNPNTSYSGLEVEFPKSLQGNRGVFTTIESAQIEGKGVRNFLKPEEIINLTDYQVAVSSQWGISNICNIIKRAEELGYIITQAKS